MVDRASSEIAADGHANHAGRRVRAVGAPAHQAQFVAQLMHRRPDVIEELDLDYGFKPPDRHAQSAADNISLRQARVVDAVRTEFLLQAGGQLEDAAFPFHQAFA